MVLNKKTKTHSKRYIFSSPPPIFAGIVLMWRCLYVIIFLSFLSGAVTASSPNLDDLLDAIEQVESGGNPLAIGDSGKAVGAFQIHPITVRDANRILGKETYCLKDRYDKQKSRDICRIIITHYEDTFEAMARRWNGGTNWEDKPATKGYWRKVKRLLFWDDGGRDKESSASISIVRSDEQVGGKPV